MSAPLYVVIPTHGRAPLLARTLASLAACRLPERYRETIVVENGSRAGAEAVVAEADARLRARYVHVERANKSNALNEVLSQLPSEALVVYLDDDVRLEAGVLASYVQVSAGVERGQFYGGPVEVDYEQEPESWLVPYFPPSARGWKPRDAGAAEIRFLGANWAAFVVDVLEVGGFDVNRGPGTNSVGQESEMQVRLMAAGVRPVYVEQALLWHYVPAERCSPQWTLRRAHKVGVSLGRQKRVLQRWRTAEIIRMLYQWFRNVSQYARSFRADTSLRFETRYHLTKQTGRVVGYVRG